MTRDEILQAMCALESTSTAPTCEPITVSGWYECTDGTYARIYWSNGRTFESARLRADASLSDYERLEAEGYDASTARREIAQTVERMALDLPYTEVWAVIYSWDTQAQGECTAQAVIDCLRESAETYTREKVGH